VYVRPSARQKERLEAVPVEMVSAVGFQATYVVLSIASVYIDASTVNMCYKFKVMRRQIVVFPNICYKSISGLFKMM